jgi:hypothetical protein
MVLLRVRETSKKIEMARTSKAVECKVFPQHGKNAAGPVAKSYGKREVFEATFVN